MRPSLFYLFTVILLIPLSFLAFGTAPLSLNSGIKTQGVEVSIVNRTTAFQVVKARINDQVLSLSFKNNYFRRVTAFVITIGDDYRISEDFASEEAADQFGIEPQETIYRSYSLSAADVAKEITIQAVALDDKTGDGNPIAFEDIRDNRLGQAIQIERSLKVLSKYLESSTPSNSQQLKHDLKATLNGPETDTIKFLKELHPTGAINRRGDGALSEHIKTGLDHAKSDVLRRIDEAESSGNERAALTKLKEYYQTLLARL